MSTSSPILPLQHTFGSSWARLAAPEAIPHESAIPPTLYVNDYAAGVKRSYSVATAAGSSASLRWALQLPGGGAPLATLDVVYTSDGANWTRRDTVTAGGVAHTQPPTVGSVLGPTHTLVVAYALIPDGHTGTWSLVESLDDQLHRTDTFQVLSVPAPAQQGWARRVGDSYLTAGTSPAAWCSDDSVVLSRSVELKSPGTSKVRWDFLCPDAARNTSTFGSYFSYELTYSAIGSEQGGSHQVTELVYHSDPSRSKQLRSSIAGNWLSTYSMIYGEALPVAGSWRIVQSQDGRIVCTETLSVLDLEVKDFKAAPSAFWPTLSSSTDLSATVHAAPDGSWTPGSLTWTLSLQDSSERTVRTATGPLSAASPWDFTWNGTDDAGHEVAPGLYTAVLAVTDTTHQACGVATGLVCVGTLSISSFTLSTAQFSFTKNVPETLRIEGTVQTQPEGWPVPDGDWTITIRQADPESPGTTVRTFRGNISNDGLSSLSLTLEWDGMDESGEFVPFGLYEIEGTVSAGPVTLHAAATVSVLIYELNGLGSGDDQEVRPVDNGTGDVVVPGSGTYNPRSGGVNPVNGNYFLKTSGRLYLKNFELPANSRSLNTLDSTMSEYGYGWRSKMGLTGPLAQLGENVFGSIWGASFLLNPDGSLSPTPGTQGSLQRPDPNTWVYTSSQGFQFFFDQRGRPTRSNAPNGDAIEQFVYDDKYSSSGPGLIRAVIGTTGYAVDFAYDDQQRIVRATFSDRAHTYVYSPAGDLVQAIDPLGQVTAYTYDSAHRLTSLTDPNGAVALQLAYDGAGRVASKTLADGGTYSYAYQSGKTTVTTGTGKVTVYEYDSKGQVTRETYPDGASVSRSYDPQTGKVTTITNGREQTRSFAYDQHGNVTRATDPLGNVSRIDYDDTTHKPVSITDPMGNTTSAQYEAGQLVGQTDPTGVGSTYTYTPLGLIATETDSLGNTSSYEYRDGKLWKTTDPQGNVTVREYDANRNLIKITDPLKGETRYDYDAFGRLISIADPQGGVTAYVYDASGNLIQETDPAGRVLTHRYDGRHRRIATTDAGVTRTWAYDVDGRLISETDDQGLTATFEHDAADRIIRKVDPQGQSTQWEYDANGNATKFYLPDGRVLDCEYDAADQLVKVTNAGTGFVTRYEFDALGRPIRKISDADEVYFPPEITTASYDAAGRITRLVTPEGLESRLEYDQAGRPARLEKSDGQVQQFQYDELGRQVGVTDGLGRTVGAAFDPTGKVLASYQATGAPRYYVRDALGRPIKSVDALGAITETEHDPVGNILSITDARGNRTRFEYNVRNQVTRVTYPGGTGRSFSYDVLFRLVSMTDGRGLTTSYGYDDAGRMARITYADGSTAEFGYDSEGRVTMVTDATGTSFIDRDILGRVIGRSDAQGRSVRFRYDARGRKNQMIRDNGTTVTYVYDDRNRLESIIDSVAGICTNVYDGTGRIVERRLPNGCKQRMTYDSAGRVLEVRHVDANGADLTADLKYAYDVNNNRLTIQDGTSPLWALQYDADNRLVSATDAASATTAWSYDSVHNRTLVTPPGSSPVLSSFNTLNQLVNAGSDEFVHDGEGNLVQKRTAQGVTRYEYDVANRLKKIVHPDLTETVLEYNGLGEVIAIVAPEGTRTELLWSEGDLLAEYSGNTTRVYLEHLGCIENGSASWFHRDALGSVLALSNTNGSVTDRWSYSPWGESTRVLGSSGQPFRFNGQYYLEQAGLILFPYRAYDPALGRFIQRDPAGFPANPEGNLYLYAGANPASAVDFKGLSWVAPDGSLVFNNSAEYLQWQIQQNAAGRWVAVNLGPGGITVTGLYNQQTNTQLDPATGMPIGVNMMATYGTPRGYSDFFAIGGPGFEGKLRFGMALPQVSYGAPTAYEVSQYKNYDLFGQQNPGAPATPVVAAPTSKIRVVLAYGPPHGSNDTAPLPITQEEEAFFTPDKYLVTRSDGPITRDSAAYFLQVVGGLLWISCHAGGVGLDLVGGTLVMDGYKGNIAPKIFAISGCNAFYYARKLESKLNMQAIFCLNSEITPQYERTLRDSIFPELAAGTAIGPIIEDLKYKWQGKYYCRMVLNHIVIVGDSNAKL